MTWSYSSKTLSEREIDFPSVNPKVSCRQHRYVFASYGREAYPVSSPLQGVIKMDLLKGTEQTWIGAADEYLGDFYIESTNLVELFNPHPIASLFLTLSYHIRIITIAAVF